MNIKKAFLCFPALVLCALMPMSALADTATDPLPVSEKIATEYLNETQYDNPFKDYVATVIGETELKIEAKSALLMEAESGQILYSSNPDEKLAPASITKIMSLLLVMEALDEGKIHLDDTVSTSETAASMGGSQIWLEVGEVMTVHELLKAVTVASANDATVALAEKVSGSVETFVELMNRRAMELGCNNTSFENSTGLDSDGHVTTAKDIAIMSRELLKHPKVKEYSCIWMDTLRGGDTKLVNTNKMVRFYEGCTGLKTGTTSKAGNCLVATAERNDMELIAVIMGADNSDKRFAGARKLLDHGFANYESARIDVDAKELAPVKIAGGTEKFVQPKMRSSLNVLVPKGKAESIEKTVELPEELEAPVKEGEVIGKVSVRLDGEALGAVMLESDRTVEKMTFFKALKRVCIGLFRL